VLAQIECRRNASQQRLQPVGQRSEMLDLDPAIAVRVLQQVDQRISRAIVVVPPDGHPLQALFQGGADHEAERVRVMA
jgi:hypothetical protein